MSYREVGGGVVEDSASIKDCRVQPSKPPSAQALPDIDGSAARLHHRVELRHQ